MCVCYKQQELGNYFYDSYNTFKKETIFFQLFSKLFMHQATSVPLPVMQRLVQVKSADIPFEEDIKLAPRLSWWKIEDIQ